MDQIIAIFSDLSEESLIIVNSLSSSAVKLPLLY